MFNNAVRDGTNRCICCGAQTAIHNKYIYIYIAYVWLYGHQYIVYVYVFSTEHSKTPCIKTWVRLGRTQRASSAVGLHGSLAQMRCASGTQVFGKHGGRLCDIQVGVGQGKVFAATSQHVKSAFDVSAADNKCIWQTKRYICFTIYLRETLIEWTIM